MGTESDTQVTSDPYSTSTVRYGTVLLIGAPGAGKGTQGAILGRIPGFYHCACGDVFRNIDITSEVGNIFYQYSSRGDLVPDDITVKMWANAINAHKMLGDYKPTKDLLILDGIPRTVEQARIIDNHIDVLKILYLTCDDEEAMFQRLRRRALKENRPDDAEESVIRKRWAVYEEETLPVLEHYDPDLIVNIDSIGVPAIILRDIVDVVAPIQNKHFAAYEE